MKFLNLKKGGVIDSIINMTIYNIQKKFEIEWESSLVISMLMLSKGYIEVGVFGRTIIKQHIDIHWDCVLSIHNGFYKIHFFCKI